MGRRRIKRAMMVVKVPEGVAPEAYVMAITAELKGCEFRGADGLELAFVLGRNRISRFRAAAKKLGIKREDVRRQYSLWEWRDR